VDDFQLFLSIGDSLSIDTYPAFDLEKSRGESLQGVGAAALLYRNVPAVWPDFNGMDLLSCYPNLRYVNLSSDGGTTFDFLETHYLAFVPDHQTMPMLVTITLGGNDLLKILRTKENDGENGIAKEVQGICQRYSMVVEALMKKAPRAICVLNSIYDPSDGTGRLPGMPDFSTKLRWLGQVNQYISDFASQRNCVFADIHGHFMGHGISAPSSERYYWEPNPIEPSARGASEIRRLWFAMLLSEGIIRFNGG
jgi:lysophospholipase L1-like esterase